MFALIVSTKQKFVNTFYEHFFSFFTIQVTVQTSALKKPASAIDFKKMGGYP